MRSFQGPVQIHKPMAVPDVLPAGLSGIHAAQLREVGRRRIIVQVDTGNVLGLELDRSEKVQSVKKKVQAALCVPTDQSALVFGDHVIDDDLSQVRDDTPLLLTRGLQRSSSTPCLSPTSPDLQQPKDWSQPVELVGGGGTSDRCPAIKRLIEDSVEAIHSGVAPVLATGGLGGAYYFKDSSGQSIAIVKPTDEEPFAPNNPKGFVGKVLGEPGLKRSIRVGETGIREVAAYLLDYGNFARVPPTSLVKVRHPVFNVNREISAGYYQGEGSPPVAKIASFQQFVKHDSDASDIGTSSFPVSAVHRIGILDVRIFNTDRHGGNILVRKVETGGWRGASFELVPIDHGLCLPETLDDPYFEWLHWPQASMPFSEEELEYIQGLDPYEDAEMLRRELPMLREGCLRMLVLCTTFLKNAARSGLTLAEIGAMMSRELCGDNEELSELEKVCVLAKLQADRDLAEEGTEDEDEEDDSIEEEGLDVEDDDEVLGNLDFPLEIDEDEDQDEDEACQIVAEVDDAAKAELLPAAILDELAENNPGNGYYTGRSVLLRLRPFGSPKYSSSRYDTNSSSMRRFLSARNSSCHHRRHRSNSSSSSTAAAGGGGAAAAAAAAAAVTSSGAAATPGAGEHPENLVFSAMSGEQWEAFLGQFEELLDDAFVRRKTDNLNFVQRLGTSCQF